MKKTIFLFDTETTGLPLYKEKVSKYHKAELVEDLTKQPSIVQLGGMILEYETETGEWTERVTINELFKPAPGCTFSPEASEVTGINEETVKDKFYFKDYINNLKLLLNCDYIVCHNGYYDLLMLKMELEREVRKNNITFKDTYPNYKDRDTIEDTLYTSFESKKGIREGLTPNNEDTIDVKAKIKKDREKWIQDNIENNLKFKNYNMPSKDVFNNIINFGDFGEKLIDTCCIGVNYCKLEKPDEQKGFGDKYKRPKLEEMYKIMFNKGFDNAHDAFADIEATKKIFKQLVDEQYIKL